MKCWKMKKKNFILDKLVEKDSNVKNKKVMLEKDMMYKHEYEELKRSEKKKIINRLSKINEFNRTKTVIKLNEKAKKIDEFKEFKNQMTQKRIEMASQVSKQKLEVVEKFDKMMRKNKGISVDTIREIFPDDRELIERLSAMKGSNPYLEQKPRDQKNESYMKNSYNNSTSSRGVHDGSTKIFNDINKEKLIEEYRQQLNHELLTLLDDEKIREEEREKNLMIITDIDEKRKLEILINLERSQFSRKIVEINQERDRKVREYEASL